MSAAPVAITLGDPRGIGPEVMSRAAELLRREQPDLPVILLGGEEPPGGLLEGEEFRRIPGWDGTEEGAGRASLDAIQAGVDLCLSGQAGALVTGPVHKQALWKAGTRVPGQTEFLQELTGAPEVGMLMAAESSLLDRPIRVLLATTHLPLRDVPDRITAGLIERQTLLLHESLQTGWSVAAPRIALCGLNPHASDGGLFGTEEAEILEPCVRSMQEHGIAVEGPFPADTVFRRAADGEFDAVVAPYHDVGMAAFKSLAFGGGVNTTLGLPFPRTSPDHGTAFDLVGTGTADWGSALEALRLAVRLAGKATKQ